MNKTSLTLIIAIIVLLILGMFLGKDDAQTVNDKSTDTNVTESDELVRKLNVQHSYNDGEHIFAGIINVPTPCHNVDVSSEDSEGGVALSIDLTTTDDTCTQVVTSKSFLYSVMADEEVSSEAMVDGEKVELNLFEKDSIEEIDVDSFSSKG